MTNKELDQIKSYSKLIVYELHKAIFDEAVFDKLKATLHLAEELELLVDGMALKFSDPVIEPPTNIVQFQRNAR